MAKSNNSSLIEVLVQKVVKEILRQAGRELKKLPKKSNECNSCIRGVDRIAMRERRMFCTMRPWEEGQVAVNQIRRTYGMKITVEEGKRGNIAAMEKKLKKS